MGIDMVMVCRNTVIYLAIILTFGCTEKNKLSLGLCYDYRMLMLYSDVEDESLYLVVGDFLQKPNKFEASSERISIEGYSKNNTHGKVEVKRRKGMIKIVSLHNKSTIEKDLPESDFWRINQLVGENVNFAESDSLQKSLTDSFYKVLGKKFADEFSDLVELENNNGVQ